MIDFGIYEIQQFEGGSYYLVEQLSGEDKIFNTLIELIQYLKTDLQALENDQQKAIGE